MGSNPTPPSNDLDEKPLTADEGWDLIFSSFGSAKDIYAEYGGGEASERAAWADEPDR